MIPEAGLLLDYPTTIRCQASPGLFGYYPKLGFSRTVRPLYDAGLLPDYPNDPKAGLIPDYPATFRNQAFPLPQDCARPFYEGNNVSI